MKKYSFYNINVQTFQYFDSWAHQKETFNHTANMTVKSLFPFTVCITTRRHNPKKQSTKPPNMQNTSYCFYHSTQLQNFCGQQTPVALGKQNIKSLMNSIIKYTFTIYLYESRVLTIQET